MTKLVQAAHSESLKSSAPSPFEEGEWLEVLQAMEEAYTQSLQYQTEIEEKNLALNQAHQFISGIVSSMSDLLIVIDNEHNITQVNPAFLELTGLNEDSVIHHSILDFVQTPQPIKDSLLKQGISLQDLQGSLHTLHGNIPISMSCSCLNPDQCDFKGKVIVARPIGELLTAYEALKKAHQELAQTKEKMVHSEKMAALGRLVSGVAHELNTPISVLKGNLWSLKSYFDEVRPFVRASNEEIEEILEDTPDLFADSQQALKHIADIVKSLKTFSQPHSEKANQLIEIKPILKTATNWVQANSKELTSPTITFSASENLWIHGNPQALQQVVINIVQNAFDALSSKKIADPLNKQIAVHLDKKQQWVEILIEDNGPGIPEEQLERIFDPFFTDKDVGEGTGLGLSISHQLIQSMHGELNVWNRPEGGAAFQILLPGDENLADSEEIQTLTSDHAQEA
ncbi:ATP-binding protein [Thiomicrorhabdus heinhorstiae]|uniref:histidine kinase n=1 Tax=Thiomicrorhabdus heinhorstiae TaxID=2748010 RepID=A0ABS0BVB6_9GAMM|nr:ATP-binding protein [Thiomicrorhabdus heinhorstiae]MBF6057777.1 PAS domain-containing protein [Thiomicrorhabdus heinhorstiae]